MVGGQRCRGRPAAGGGAAWAGELSTQGGVLKGQRRGRDPPVEVRILGLPPQLHPALLEPRFRLRDRRELLKPPESPSFCPRTPPLTLSVTQLQPTDPLRAELGPHPGGTPLEGHPTEVATLKPTVCPCQDAAGGICMCKGAPTEP